MGHWWDTPRKQPHIDSGCTAVLRQRYRPLAAVELGAAYDSNAATPAVQVAAAGVSDRPSAVAHGRQLRGELIIIASILGAPVIDKVLTQLCLQARGPAHEQMPLRAA